jgi:hypothetical protein
MVWTFYPSRLGKILRFCASVALVFALLCRFASATTHVVITDGHGVYIGSDGITGIGDYGTSSVCKLIARGNMAFLDWGAVTLYPADADLRTATPVFDFRSIARTTLGKHLSPAQTYARLAEIARGELQRRVRAGKNVYFFAPYTPDELARLHIGGLLIWMDKGVPNFREFNVRQTRAGGGFEPEDLPMEKFQPNKPYQFPEDFMKEGQVSSDLANHNGAEFVAKHPYQVIEEILDATAKLPSQRGKVGKPYALAHLTDKGVVWYQGKTLCEGASPNLPKK